jgi:hypothetical protein
MGYILWYLKKPKQVGKLFQTIVVKGYEALINLSNIHQI